MIRTTTDPDQPDTEAAAPPEEPAAGAVGSSGAARGRGAARFRLVLLAVLVLAVVASVAALVWLLAGRRGEAADEQAQREQVMSQARDFMVTINTYGPDLLDGTEMPQYRDDVSQLITPKFDADFEQNVPNAEATVAQGGLGRTAEVYGTAVSTIDADSATALVAGSFTNSYPETEGSQTRVDAEPSPFRVEVQLVRTDGRWLVDDFTPVNAAEDNGSGLSDVPEVDPSLLPSEEPTPSGTATEAPSGAATEAPSGEPSGGATP